MQADHQRQTILTIDDARERHARAQLLRSRDAERRLVRLRPNFVGELPSESTLDIEINGIHVNSVTTVDEALPEFVLGWALMHGYIQSVDDVDHLHVHDGHASLMIPQSMSIDDDLPTDGPIHCIDEKVLIQILTTTWNVFKTNGLLDGFAQAAVIRDAEVACVARDVLPEFAVAKTLGWALDSGADRNCEMLVISGSTNAAIVRGARRAGISVVASSGLPTADAYRLAITCDISLVGMANMRSIGLLVDNGHIVQTDDIDIGIADD